MLYIISASPPSFNTSTYSEILDLFFNHYSFTHILTSCTHIDTQVQLCAHTHTIYWVNLMLHMILGLKFGWNNLSGCSYWKKYYLPYPLPHQPLITWSSSRKGRYLRRFPTYTLVFLFTKPSWWDFWMKLQCLENTIYC